MPKGNSAIGWKIGVEPNGRHWSTIEDSLGDQAGTFAAKRQRSSRHFVEDDAEGKDVGPRIERFGADLLRRHVSNRANSGARAGEMSFGHFTPSSGISNIVA